MSPHTVCVCDVTKEICRLQKLCSYLKDGEVQASNHNGCSMRWVWSDDGFDRGCRCCCIADVMSGGDVWQTVHTHAHTNILIHTTHTQWVFTLENFLCCSRIWRKIAICPFKTEPGNNFYSSTNDWKKKTCQTAQIKFPETTLYSLQSINSKTKQKIWINRINVETNMCIIFHCLRI